MSSSDWDFPTDVEETRPAQNKARRNSTVSIVLVILGGIAILAGGIYRLSLEDIADPSAFQEWGWLGFIGLGFVLMIIGSRLRGRR